MKRRHRAKCELGPNSNRCLCDAFWFQISLGLGLTVVLVEFLGSLYSGSLALLADGAHTLVDVAFYAVAIYVQRRLYARPWEDEHAWEHRAGKLNGILFLLVAIGIVVEAFHRGPDSRVDVVVMGWVAFAGLILNTGQFWVLKLGAQNRTNKQVNAHNKGDALQSGVICVAAFLSYFGADIPAPLIDIGLSVFLAMYFTLQGLEALDGEHHH